MKYWATWYADETPPRWVVKYSASDDPYYKGWLPSEDAAISEAIQRFHKHKRETESRLTEIEEALKRFLLQQRNPESTAHYDSGIKPGQAEQKGEEASPHQPKNANDSAVSRVEEG